MVRPVRSTCLWIALLCIAQANTTYLRVACRSGLPPFADVVNGNCVGIMADLFSMVAKTAGFNYTITPINYVATQAVTVNRTTNRPQRETIDTQNTAQ